MNEKIINVLDEIMENFDFEKVKKVIDTLDWKWDGLERFDPTDNFKLKKGFYVPTLDEIKQFAANLLWDCANMKDAVVATGGFRVEKDFSDPEDPWMRLAFEVTDWDEGYSESNEED